MQTNHLSKILFSLLLFCTITLGLSQNLQLSDQAKISVLTCGTGNESYSLFGHTAIRVQDSTNGIDYVYNYGAFDFRTPNFVAKFAKGDLQYFVITNSFTDFISSYTSEKRSVYEQQLNINNQKRQVIFDNLNHVLLSDERFYTYKFIDKNCTSMVVDIINKSLGGAVITKKGNHDTTYRSVLYPYFDGHFYEKLGTSIIFGTKVDRKASKIFLPFELKSSLAQTSFQNQKLAPTSDTLLSFEKEPVSSWWNNWYTYLLFLALILLIDKKAVNFTYLTLLALLGIFFVVMGFYSFHHELEYNYNILLFNPLLLFLIVFASKKNKKMTFNLAILHLLLLVVYSCFIVTKAYFLIVLPLIVTTSTILVRIALQNKKRIPIII